MKKQQWYLYLMLLSVIILSLLFGNRFMYENAATMSSQKTEYIQELRDDLGDVKIKIDDVVKDITVKQDRNKVIENTIQKEQPVLASLIRRKQDGMNEYLDLHSKWSLGLYLDPIVQLQLSDTDHSSIINIAKSPDNNLPTDTKPFYNSDVNGYKTNIIVPSYSNLNIFKFYNNSNSYISFPVFYMDQFTFMFYRFIDKNDNNYSAVIQLVNKNSFLNRNDNQAIQLDIQQNKNFIYNRVGNTADLSVMYYDFPDSGWCHFTYVYNYDTKTDTSNIYIYDNGNLVNSKSYKGRLQQYLKTMNRFDTFILGRAFFSESNRSYAGYVGYFKFFAYALSDKIIKRNINSNPKPSNLYDVNCVWK